MKFVWHCEAEGLTLDENNVIYLAQLKNLGKGAKMNENRELWLRFFKEGKQINLEDPPSWAAKSHIIGEAMSVLSTISKDRKQYLIYDSQEKVRREEARKRNRDRLERELQQTELELQQAKEHASREMEMAREHARREVEAREHARREVALAEARATQAERHMAQIQKQVDLMQQLLQQHGIEPPS